MHLEHIDQIFLSKSSYRHEGDYIHTIGNDATGTGSHRCESTCDPRVIEKGKKAHLLSAKNGAYIYPKRTQNHYRFAIAMALKIFMLCMSQ